MPVGSKLAKVTLGFFASVITWKITSKLVRKALLLEDDSPKLYTLKEFQQALAESGKLPAIETLFPKMGDNQSKLTADELLCAAKGFVLVTVDDQGELKIAYDYGDCAPSDLCGLSRTIVIAAAHTEGMIETGPDESGDDQDF